MSNESQHKKVRVRSPAYPAFSLKVALDKAQTIYRHEKRTAAPVAVVTKHCGLDIKSSGALRLIAALKQFGLVVELGSGDDRKVKLSDLALDILLSDSDDSPKRAAAVKVAALSPKIHKNLWDHYNGELPSDATMKAYLLRELEFNDTQVDGFIREFRSTIAFAKLAPTDIIAPADDADEEENSQFGADEMKRQFEEPIKEKEKPHVTPPLSPSAPYISFPLPGGNVIEIRLRSKVSPKDFATVKKLIELSESSLVDLEAK